MRTREIKYDVVRALAILCVVLCHSSEAIYKFEVNEWNSLSLLSKIFMIVSFTIGRLGVPLFLFLTGALILKKNIEKDEDIKKFYTHNLLPLLVVNAIWILIYNCFFLINNSIETFKLEFVVKELLFIRLVPLDNYWYMPMIISMYVVLPFIAKVVKSFDKKSLLLVLFVAFVVGFVIPGLNILFYIFNINEHYIINLRDNFFGGTYGLYIILGYYMSQKQKINKLLCSFAAIISFFMICVIEAVSYNLNHYIYNVWYDFPLLLICCCCLFLIIINVDYKNIKGTFKEMITFISKISLFIYFAHFIFIVIFKSEIASLNILNPYKVLALYFIAFIICVALGYLFAKSKKLRKYFLIFK